MCAGCDTQPDCERAVHGACWFFGRKHAASACWMCPACRIGGYELSEEITTEEAEDAELAASVRTVSGRRQATLGSIETVVKKGEEFARARRIRNVFTHPAALAAYLRWLSEQTSSFSTCLTHARVGGRLSMSLRKDRVNTFKDRRVREQLEEIAERVGTDTVPDVPLPPEMLRDIIATLEAGKRPRLDSRLHVCAVGEYQGGARLGEMTGDRYGLTCGPRTARIFARRFEGRLQCSKSSTSEEYLTLPDTEGELKLSMRAAVLEMVKRWGLTLSDPVTDPSTGEEYRYIDYAVVRVGLNGISDEQMARLKEDLACTATLTPVVEQELARRADRRRNALDEQQRYINVEEGTRAEMDQLVDRWTRAGYVASVDDGPLILSSVRGIHRVPMPWSCGSLSGEAKAAMETAYARLLERGGSADISELDIDSAGPKWNTHSFRRGGDKLARRLMRKPGCQFKEIDIDLHFRWRVAELSKSQQLHYEGRRGSDERCAVTIDF